MHLPQRTSSRGARALVAVVLLATCPATAARDVVVRRDGGTVEGRVRSLDERAVVVAVGSDTVRIPRDEVASIRFDEPDVPPLKVEIRNVRSDDAVTVLLDDVEVLRDAREGGVWVDLTPRLKDGHNPLRLRIRNDRGTWAYRLHLRINGDITTLACGTALRQDDPCRCCGKTGRELGVLDDLPALWIHVDRALGRAEVIP